jgi:DNA topoisomerase-2
LVNRCHGTGVGWSTKIPNYSAKDIIEALESLLCGKDLPELTPFYVGFTGDIKQTPDQDGFYTYGRVSLLGGNFFRIEDLPINIWTENFKKKLASTPFVQVNDINNY